MDKRSDASKSGYREDVSSHSKKSKKRSSKWNSVFELWMDDVQNNQNNVTPDMEYQQVLWQSNMQQNFQNNGQQRLFTTASDPSMCGYTPMPMTYTMEPVSLPTMYRLYQAVPFSGMRTVHGRPRRHGNQNHPMNLGMNSGVNGFTSLQENGLESPVPVNYQNGDYTSLPPTASKNNGINREELNSEHRRYSDPGLGSAEAPVHTQSEDSDSADNGSSITTIGRSNKLVLSLIEQMTELKKSNSQLFRELSETKSEVGTMKAKLAQCKYDSSSDYRPGMLSDLIREIREANKACEEGLAAKVKFMVEEKLNQRSLEMDNLNSRILNLMEEKEESDRRIAKLEEEVATLKLSANNEGREIAAFEEETLALRRELQEARASKTLAETHVAKCVNARSVTPVSFETPYVTSTPVRTALSNTCSLIPAATPSSIPTHAFASILRSRSAELAHHFVPEKPNLYRTADCSPAPRSLDENPGKLSSSQSTVSAKDPEPEDASLETSSLICPESFFEKETKRRDDVETAIDVEPVEQRDEDQQASKEEESKVDSPQKEADSGTITSAASEKRAKGSRSESNNGQKGSSKKSKKKKGNSVTKRPFGEAEKSASNDSAAKEGRRTVSEDEDRLDDDETSRAITEIPEVTVVGGGSFLSKDLCSTGILTSRVLTAPSRATYTTAYI